MGSIREFRDFKGNDVVLLLLNQQELRTLRQALDVFLRGDETSIMLGDRVLSLRKQSRATGVNIAATGAELCLTEADAEQMAGLLDGLLEGSGSGHQYMDIAWPTPTLMISVGEYPEGFGDDG